MKIYKITEATFNVQAYKTPVNPLLNWSEWKLVFNGNEYYSKFKNQDEWYVYYNK